MHVNVEVRYNKKDARVEFHVKNKDGFLTDAFITDRAIEDEFYLDDLSKRLIRKLIEFVKSDAK